mmetsp:Transcript_15451/g.28599  ORF Transcript_15451/g.28599 Transcript_15451/m.28599 type:complete len:231 (+) Transcript_15451:48-740(+)
MGKHPIIVQETPLPPIAEESCSSWAVIEDEIIQKAKLDMMLVHISSSVNEEPQKVPLPGVFKEGCPVSTSPTFQQYLSKVLGHSITAIYYHQTAEQRRNSDKKTLNRVLALHRRSTDHVLSIQSRHEADSMHRWRRIPNLQLRNGQWPCSLCGVFSDVIDLPLQRTQVPMSWDFFVLVCSGFHPVFTNTDLNMTRFCGATPPWQVSQGVHRFAGVTCECAPSERIANATR